MNSLVLGRLPWFLALALSVPILAASAQDPPAASATPHLMVAPDSLSWQPSTRTPGLSTAVAEGDPGKPGSFVLMLKIADGAWIPPHWHNVDKRLVVIRGQVRMGMGDRLDPAATRLLPAGGIAVVPAGSRHYEGGTGETIVALLATGPFTTAFVDPPRP